MISKSITLFFLILISIAASAQTAQENLDAGKDFYQKKLFEDALKSLDAALKQDSTLHAAYFYRGLVKGNLGSFDKSIPDFQNAAKLAPQRDDYWLYLGMAYDLGKKDKANALLSFNKALEVNPKSKDAYLRRGLLNYSMMEDAKACADFTKAIENGNEQAKALKAKYCPN
jgi:tetratricopeptide (TPR) repeat protein